MEKVSFNLNNSVFVKLTDKGKRVIKELHDKKWKEWGFKPSGSIFPKEDEHGYGKWQMWGLLEAFGLDFHIGMIPGPFDVEIFFKKSDLKEASDEN